MSGQREKHKGYGLEDAPLDSPPDSPETQQMLKELGIEVRGASFFGTFESVLPEGVKSLREYFDSILPEGATFVEYGGPGRALRKGFSEGRISRSAGVTIDVPKGKDVPGHTVIQGDIRDGLDEQVSEALGGAQPDVVIERMRRGLDVADFTEEEFIALIEKWYKSARIVALIQVPIKHNDAVAAWVEKLRKESGGALEVVFYEGAHNSSVIYRHSALLIRKITPTPVVTVT